MKLYQVLLTGIRYWKGRINLSEQRFSFGRNWTNYVRNVVNEQTIAAARDSLLRYLPAEEFRGATFIDVGCGSGLFSLGALLHGCREVISFDIDEDSLGALALLRERYAHLLPQDATASWKAFQGDVLNEKMVEQLSGKGDIVYSWGVLHHTGQMWKAIDNAARLVAPGGHFIIAIYNHAPSSDLWWRVKRFYNQYRFLQPLLGVSFALFVVLRHMRHNRSLNLYRERGMHLFYDAIDWIGGYPYEYACFDDVTEYVQGRGFTLIGSPTRLPCGKGQSTSFMDALRTMYTGCNEFVFQKAIP